MQRETIAQKSAEEFWLTLMKTGHCDPLFGKNRGLQTATSRFEVTLSPALIEALEQVGKGKAFNKFKLLLAAYIIVLEGYAEGAKLIRLPVVPYQPDPGDGPVFIALNIAPGQNARDVLKALHVGLEEGVAHRNYNLDSLVGRYERLHGKRPDVHEQFAMHYVQAPGTASPERAALLELIVQDGAEPRLSFRGNSAFYTIENLRGLAENLLWVLTEILRDQSVLVEYILPPCPAEREKLSAFNDNDVPFPDVTILDQFEEAARRYPGRIAVRCSDRSLSYRELDNMANDLANRIHREVPDVGEHIAVFVSRSEFFPVAVLGALKTGASYIPLDPSLPLERIKACVARAGCKVMLSEPGLIDIWEHLVDLTVVDVRQSHAGAEAACHPMNGAAGAAYVIFTSGSTGEPKGVVVSHRSLVNHVQWFVSEYGINESDATCIYASFSFDGTLTSFWSMLTRGGALHIWPDNIFDPEAIAHYIHAEHITFLKTVPTAFYALLQSRFYAENGFPSLKFVKVGGENFDVRCAELFWEKHPHAGLANHYGLTEGGVGTSIRHINPESLERFRERPNVGFPFHNNKAYILDRNDRFLPIGAAGQLVIGGASLAESYLGLPELNRQRFFIHPDLGRLFRTNDQARWLPDGSVEFLTRSDRQVKLRGYRIELEEIEACLLRIPDIEKARAELREVKGDPALVAYYVSSEPQEVTTLRKQLGNLLPAYMVPSHFVHLSVFPVSRNGKLDWRALPEPVSTLFERRDGSGDHDPAVQALVRAWEKVLNVKHVPLDKEYLELGGDSIKAIQIVAEVRKQGFKLALNHLFENATIAVLAKKMEAMGVVTNQEPVTGRVKLAPIQHAFFDQKYAARHHWNQSVMLYQLEPFDLDRLEHALLRITEHHDALRMVYREEQGEVIQESRSPGEGPFYALDFFDVSGAQDQNTAIAEHVHSVQSSLSLEAGLLVHLAVYRTSGGDHLQCVIHHLAIDAVSFRIFLEDLMGLYHAAPQEAYMFPLKTASFSQWTDYLTSRGPEGMWKTDREYWLSRTVPDGVFYFRSDHGLQQAVNGGGKFRLVLSADYADRIPRANEAFNSRTAELVLAAWVMAWRTWTGLDSCFLRMETHGRYELPEAPDISRTIGWFTSEYPLLVKPAMEGVAGTITCVKNELGRIPHHGIGFGIWKYLQRVEILSGQLPEVSFNYLGELDLRLAYSSVKISDLSPGHNRSPKASPRFYIDVNAWIHHGELHVDIASGLAESWTGRVQQLAELMEQRLKHVIDFCCEQSAGARSVTDFSHSGLDEAELDRIFDQLENE